MTTTDTPRSTKVDMPAISVADQVVAVGAALLDAEQPGWHTRINISALKLSDCARCVLGQLFESFDLGVTDLLEDDWCTYGVDQRFTFACAHGFDTEELAGEPTYDELTQAWLTAINARRWSAIPGNLTTAGGAR